MVAAQSAFWKIWDFAKLILVSWYSFVPKSFCMRDIKLKLGAAVWNYCHLSHAKFGDFMWRFNGRRTDRVSENMGFYKDHLDFMVKICP